MEMADLPIVIAAEADVTSEDPLLARLRLHTDRDAIDVALNRSAAEAIIRVLKGVLEGSA